MWHVDEGALHAYLDGALDEYPAAEARRVREHLETCPECSERLAEERRVREEAQDILALAAPRVDMPTFEELRAYVKAQAPQRTRTSIRLYRLSWAASVVLALGTGWLLRGGLPATAVSPAERGFTADAEEAASGPAPEAPALEAPAPETTASELERSSGAEGELGASGAAAAAAGSGPIEQRSAAPASPSAADPQADARARPAGELRREVVERLDEAATTRAPSSEPADGLTAASGNAVTSKAADDATAEPSLADTPRSAAEPAPAPAPVAPTIAQSAADRARQDPSTPDADVAQRAPERRVTSAVRRAPAGGGLGAQTPSPGRAAGADTSAGTNAEAEATSLVVPGLEVLDVLPVGEGTTFAGMRALQRLPSGDTLETVHLPAGVDPRSLPPLRQGWSELVRARGSGWVVMRAPVPVASLGELLQRLESGR